MRCPPYPSRPVRYSIALAIMNPFCGSVLGSALFAAPSSSSLERQNMRALENSIPDQTGRTALVTGTGGLGFQVAQQLARAGAHVIIAGRNASKGAEAVRSISAAAPAGSIAFESVDLASLQSIEALAARLADIPAIDVLVNNAGIMSPPSRKTTADGFELQFGVNYLGHFALTGRLLPVLRRSAAPRVVNVTSLAHRYAKLDFSDLQQEWSYRAGKVYCQSKLAQALFTRELQRRSDLEGWSLTSVAAHPGAAQTNLFQNDQASMSVMSRITTGVFLPLFGHSAEDGAASIIYAASTTDVSPGCLYGPTGLNKMKGPPGRQEFGKAALDESVAQRLWAVSEKLAQFSFS